VAARRAADLRARDVEIATRAAVVGYFQADSRRPDPTLAVVTGGGLIELTADRKEFYPPNPFWNKIYTSVGQVTFAAPGTYQLSLVPRSLCVEDTGIKPEEFSQYLKPIIGFTFKEIILNPLTNNQ
jgi:hypothetical protein